MRAALGMTVLCYAATLAACDTTKLTVGQTSKVLARAQPAMKMESDYELAARAIPASLKTVEGFHVVDPENPKLTRILAEGYCQYGQGFIEDEWERAKLAGDDQEADYQARRATKAYLRCIGYALELLGEPWSEAITGDPARIEELAAKAGKDDRDGMMFLAMGLGGAINLNKDDIALVAHAPKVKILLQRVIELDDETDYPNKSLRALPHVALGLLATATPKALGGRPEKGKEHFERAMEITDHRFLLAKVLFARRYAVAIQDQELFRQTLVEVLQTDPAIWPEQRLANEIAHRRARRYLKHEKEWF